MFAEALPGLRGGFPIVGRALAEAARPQIARGVAQWAEEERYVASESGSSRPGKWRNATQPIGIEPMQCLDAEHPCRRVTLKFSAQMIKSEVGVNWAGQTVCDDPAPMMLVVPSLDELRNWNNTKWTPTVDATPALRRRVFEIVERAGTGSTTSFKRFRGGYFILTTASSSKGLQGRSIKRLILDEVSEFPLDAGGRGDPVKQAEARGDAHDDFKALISSTPKELPGCRVTAFYLAGDQRRYYVGCPHCDELQVLLFENLQAPSKADGRATFACMACGTLIDEIHKAVMIADGHLWIKTYVDLVDPADPNSGENPANPAPPPHFPRSELARWRARSSAGRDPSFHAWQAYSLLKSWTAIWREFEEASAEVRTGRDPDALKVFWQQKLGEAWDSATETPDHQKLFEARGRFVKTRGVVPAWTCEIIGVADVQGDRIEWDAYAIGPDLSMARFDWGVVEVDPLENEAWAELGGVVGKTFEGEAAVPLGFDIFGIDLRGKKGVTEKVYRFVRGRHNVVALAGAKDPDAIPLDRRKRRVIRLRDGGTLTVEPHLVGTFGLKTVIYGMLATTLKADKERLAGGLYNPPDATLEDFKQYTAEVFRQPKTQRAGARGWWERLPGVANERLDLAVYARALAWYRGAFTRTAAEWQAMIAKRAKRPEEAPSLFPLVDAAPAPVPAAKTAENPSAKPARWSF